MENFNLEDKDYSGSGVKAMRSMAKILFIGNMAAAFIFTATWILTIDDKDEPSIYYFVAIFASLLSGYFFKGFCGCMATIAEYHLYKKVIIEKQIVADLKAEEERNKKEEESKEE